MRLKHLQQPQVLLVGEPPEGGDAVLEKGMKTVVTQMCEGVKIEHMPMPSIHL